jgi:hypoxanthine phosphoribosyltransferase
MREIFYSWDEFKADIHLITSQMHDSGWFPNVVVGIKRGGLVPAVTLSHHMNVPMLVASCQLRDGNPNIDLSEIIKLDYNNKILLVDDICDSGETFKQVIHQFNKIGFKNIKSCSIFYNIRQSFYVDFKAKKIDRQENKKWIIFPWER